MKELVKRRLTSPQTKIVTVCDTNNKKPPAGDFFDVLSFRQFPGQTEGLRAGDPDRNDPPRQFLRPPEIDQFEAVRTAGQGPGIPLAGPFRQDGQDPAHEGLVLR